MKKTKLRKKKKFTVFGIVNAIVLSALALVTAFPLINILAVSLSDSLYADQVILFPIKFTWDSYRYLLDQSAFWTAMWVSVKRCIVAVIFRLLLAFFPAYALSRPRGTFHGRGIYAWYFFISTIFGGGTVPWYVMIAKVGLIDSFWALIRPGAVAAGDIILMLNFFKTLPRDFEEAAKMDGANATQILFDIYIPLSKAVIATVTLFTLVGHWNGWFDGMVLMNSPEKLPLQSYLRSIVITVPKMGASDAFSEYPTISQKTTNAAQIFVALVPILMVYPFLQKYFAKGITVGGVKG